MLSGKMCGASRRILHATIFIALLNPASATVTKKQNLVFQPSSVFVVGPGSILSVRHLNLPFIKPFYAVRYKLDSGELIEVWTPADGIILLKGMHGILTYSSYPEKIVNFVPLGEKPPQ
jgi:hypothetical protein